MGNLKSNALNTLMTRVHGATNIAIRRNQSFIRSWFLLFRSLHREPKSRCMQRDKNCPGRSTFLRVFESFSERCIVNNSRYSILLLPSLTPGIFLFLCLSNLSLYF